MKQKLVTPLLALLYGLANLSAQNKEVLYDFYEVPQTLMLNPGVKTPQRWHAGIPVLSNISFYAGSSGVTVSNLFADDGVDFNEKFRQAVNSMDFRDDIGLGGTITVLFGGFRGKNRPDDYYSFGMYGEGFFINYWPEDLATLLLEGNANSLGRRFDLNHLMLQGEAVNVFHFGLNRRLNTKWQVGARAKLYSSVLDIRSTGNKGYFETTQGVDNLLRNTLVANMALRTSGLESLMDAMDSNVSQQQELPAWLLERSLLGGSLGFGLDIGVTHQLGTNTYITASLLDLGFIYYSNDVKNYTLNGSASNEGLEIRLPEDLTADTSQIWQDLIDELEILVPFETNEDPYVAMRPLKLYGSIRHNWGERGYKSENCECSIYGERQRNNELDYVNAIGGQLFVINRPRGPQPALTGFYQRRLGNVLALKTTLTADRYTLTNVGLGMNLQLGPVNFYLMADNLLSYQNIADSNYASFQFGLNIISWNGY